MGHASSNEASPRTIRIDTTTYTRLCRRFAAYMPRSRRRPDALEEEGRGASQTIGRLPTQSGRWVRMARASRDDRASGDRTLVPGCRHVSRRGEVSP